MDAMRRLEPVARPLLRQVDTALATLGAPADHRVWALLRRVGLTPADAVSALCDLEPERLRAAAGAVRDRADEYATSVVPISIEGWSGAAAEAYAQRAAGLADHQHEALPARLRATASYVDSVADWMDAARDRLARCLAAVLGSTQALAIRAPSGGFATSSVMAAADIGAAVLAVVDEVITEAGASPGQWELGELEYRAASYPDPVSDRPISLR